MMSYDTDSNMKPQLLKCNEAYLLGTLATNESFYPGGETDEPITLMRNSNTVMFFIKPLSEEPSPILKYFPRHSGMGNLYIGIDTDQPLSVIKDSAYYYKHSLDKLSFWQEKLEGKLILFKPKIKYVKTKQPFLNLEIVAIEGDMDDSLEQRFICVPKVNMSQETFENKVLSGTYLSFEEYHHFYQDPAYVICGDYLYFNFQGWEKHADSQKAWRVAKQPQEIMKVRLDFNNHEFSNYVVSGTDYLEFIHEYGDMLLNDNLQEFGVSILAETPIEAAALDPIPSSIQPHSPTQLNPAISVVAPISIATTSCEEMEFIQELEFVTRKEYLYYNTMDLVNFHISIKTNPLTVVAGATGTGKSQLARAYAKTLGLSEEDGNLLFLPITPSYLEPADILGYHNPSPGLYVPAETGLVDLLSKAEKNPDCFYMVIFDEMNLSQVEHWFAPFLSLLELKPEERRLKLYGKDVICLNSSKYKDNILIGDNVIFVGTVNLDETTKDFSDRLLDRVNVVTLQKGRFTQLQEIVPTSHREKTFTYTQFRKWISTEPGIKAYTVQDLEFFDELHDLINSYDAQKGVSYRLLNKIGCYINNLPNGADAAYTLSKEDAIDLGIKQRLLTKIKGSDRQIGTLVGTTTSPRVEPTDSELLELFKGEQAQRVSSFKMTQKELRRKALELGVHGYTN